MEVIIGSVLFGVMIYLPAKLFMLIIGSVLFGGMIYLPVKLFISSLKDIIIDFKNIRKKSDSLISKVGYLTIFFFDCFNIACCPFLAAFFLAAYFVFLHIVLF